MLVAQITILNIAYVNQDNSVILYFLSSYWAGTYWKNWILSLSVNAIMEHDIL